MKYYSLNEIHRYKATYNVIFGERSNGKTYATLQHALTKYLKTGKQFIYLRRWQEDITRKRMSQLFSAINSQVLTMTKGRFEMVYYLNSKFYLANKNPDTEKIEYDENNCIGYVLAISENEHNKSISFPHVNTIIFDEFISSKFYIIDEFVAFMNSVSTIVRERDDITIYMLGNTINKYCPYFEEMGLKNISKQKQGTIDLYTYGQSSLTVAVEYCDNLNKSKKSNKYFAFDNPKLSMITKGSWEIGIYPRLTEKYTQRDVQFTFFIEFDKQVLQCEIVYKSSGYFFIFVHEKTTPIKNVTDLVYTLDESQSMYKQTNLKNPRNKVEKVIYSLIVDRKVFYSSNDVGNTFSNFIRQMLEVRI